MKITIQIPTLNEEECISRLIKEIPEGVADEILVVDAHSTDKTVEIAKSLGARVILQPLKRGFGDAHKFGFKNAIGDVVVILNADGSQDPKDIPRMIEKIKQGNDLALCSRYLPSSSTDDDTLVRFVGNKFFTFFTNLLYHTKFSDSLYFFFAVRKDKVLNLDLKSDDFAICIELLVKAHKAGFKIAEIPCIERKRFAGKSKVNALIDGSKILWQMLKWCHQSPIKENK